MNLYEFEGKQLFESYGIKIPRGVVVHRDDDIVQALRSLSTTDVVVKAQVLSGKRGKNKAIRFCSTVEEIEFAVKDLFSMDIRGQYVAAVRIEEKLDIVEEQYLSITYDTNKKQPVIIYSKDGGVDIEDVVEDRILKIPVDVRNHLIASSETAKQSTGANIQIVSPFLDLQSEVLENLWKCFLEEDARLVEINPLVKTPNGEWIAADAKVALDDDAMYRHENRNFEPRTMMGRPPTEREMAVSAIDSGEKYYQGTAGKYIELDGDIAILFSGGGASIANMDALMSEGLHPANYTEYSGNPPREKVYKLTKIVLSKPGLRGLWIAGGVANFTNVKATFQGIVDALDEMQPRYPIVVRRAGPNEEAGMQLMRECAKRNNLNMKLFGKETSMSETASILAKMIV